MTCLAERSEQSDESAALWKWMIAFVVLGVAWRTTRYGLGFPIWGDESFITTSILLHGFRELATQPLEYSQIAPLLFLWLQRAAYELWGGGEYAARIVPLVCGLGGLILFADFARRYLSPRMATTAVAVFAVSYPLVRHSCESKPYSIDAFVAAALLWAAGRWLEHPACAARAAIVTVVSVVGVWLSYPAVLAAGGASLGVWPAILKSRSPRAWKLWLMHGAALVVSFGLFYVSFARTQSDRAAGTWLEDRWTLAFPPLDNLPALGWWLLETHCGPMMAHPVGGTDFGSAGIAVLCGLGVVALVRASKGKLLWLCVAGVPLGLIAAALHKYPYGISARVMLWLAPAICVLEGAGIAAIIEAIRQPRAQKIVASVFGVVLLGLGVFGVARDVRQPFKTPEDQQVRKVTREIAQLAPRGTALWVVNQSDGAEPPDQDPMLLQTVRYYLALYRGEPLWQEKTPVPSPPCWILAYSGEFGGPDRARIDQIAAAADLAIVKRREYALGNRPPRHLFLAYCDRGEVAKRPESRPGQR